MRSTQTQHTPALLTHTTQLHIVEVIDMSIVMRPVYKPNGNVTSQFSIDTKACNGLLTRQEQVVMYHRHC
jgi:hypothetical protein